MFKTKYRVVTDAYAGYEIHAKYWWMPFYFYVESTYSSKEDALTKIVKLKKKKVVVYSD